MLAPVMATRNRWGQGQGHPEGSKEGTPAAPQTKEESQQAANTRVWQEQVQHKDGDCYRIDLSRVEWRSGCCEELQLQDIISRDPSPAHWDEQMLLTSKTTNTRQGDGMPLTVTMSGLVCCRDLPSTTHQNAWWTSWRCSEPQQAFLCGNALTYYRLPWVTSHQQARVQLATKGTARSIWLSARRTVWAS